MGIKRLLYLGQTRKTTTLVHYVYLITAAVPIVMAAAVLPLEIATMAKRSPLMTFLSKPNLFSACVSQATDWYMTCLNETPVLTKSATTGVIQVMGDYCAQGYEEFRIQSDLGKRPSILKCLLWVQQYDGRRGLSLAADGVLLSGPLMHYAFELMERIIPTQTSNKDAIWGAALLHVLANDILVDIVYLLISFVFVAIAEGHGRNLATLFRKDFFATVQASWRASALLVPIEYACICKLPVRFRVLAMNMIDILWGASVSFVAHRSRRNLKPEPLVSVTATYDETANVNNQGKVQMFVAKDSNLATNRA